jgi:PAS domain S-box-containing protein
LKVSQTLQEKGRGTFLFDRRLPSWLGAAGFAVAIGVAYFMAALLGVAVRANTGTSVFWPAAGIAVGALIVWGPGARLPVATGALVAAAAANLMIGRNVWLSVAFGVVNAGQALLAGLLIERWFGRSFKLGYVSQVLGFLVASGIGSAVGAAGATIAVGLTQPMASPFIVWRFWFASCLLGMVTVAPLLVGVAEVVRQMPRRRELIEGAVAVLMLAVSNAFVISLPQGAWSTALPVAIVFPLLLWIAARCRPVFAAVAAFVVASAVIWSITFNVGHFGDTSIPLADRMLAAQTVVLAGALLTLVLAALFAERRHSELVLKQSEQRLQLALDGAELGAFSADLATGRLECDARAALIHGHNAHPISIRESRRFVHPQDRIHIDAALAEALRTGGIWNAEYRVTPPGGHLHAGETRWVAVEGSIVRDTRGAAVGLLGVARDITDRKRAELSLADRNRQLELAAKAALVGSFAIDVDTARKDITSSRMQVSPGFCAIYGLPEETAEISVGDWRSQVHPDDLPQFLEHRYQAFAQLRREHHAEFRIVRPCGTIRWIETRSYIEYDQAGHARRLVGVNIDVTERKRAEEARTVLNAELDHRVKNALATVWAVASHTREGSRSVDGFLAALEGRLRSMATTHELLSSCRWQGLPLTELVRRELAPYATRNNTEINGPGILLKPAAGQALAMVLHELATNAAKYGALSTKEGRVSIRWDRHVNGNPRSHLVLEWQEIGGPRVVAPSAPSYGTSTIRDLIPYELGGTVDLVLAPEGVRCRLELPADCLSNDREPISETTANR